MKKSKLRDISCSEKAVGISVNTAQNLALISIIKSYQGIALV